MEIDDVLNETSGERFEQHWMDGFNTEGLEKENGVEYLQGKTAAPMSFLVAKSINGKSRQNIHAVATRTI